MDESQDPASEILRTGRELINGSFSSEKKEYMASLINELIVHDFNALVQLLYRIDVDEKKLKKMLQENPAVDSGLSIADLIIERQIEKENNRNTFRPENNSDEERW